MISDKDVLKIATLARIHLEGHETQEITKNLESILGYISTLQTLDVKGVEPTSHVLALKNVFREDIPKPSLSQEEALSIAVEKAHGSFVVPKVIE
jgi:aspartyl-tRNA(Asn)/glutamyl-tRNA(Gln) amidotransferase subunit C